jgi:hypothetical protein
MSLDIKRSFCAVRKSFTSIVVSYSIISSFEGEFVGSALSTPDKAAVDANDIGLTIFLIVFFFVRLSRILPLFFEASVSKD